MMDRSARKVITWIKNMSNIVTIGDVGQVPLVQQDQAKADPGILNGVVVNIIIMSLVFVKWP